MDKNKSENYDVNVWLGRIKWPSVQGVVIGRGIRYYIIYAPKSLQKHDILGYTHTTYKSDAITIRIWFSDLPSLIHEVFHAGESIRTWLQYHKDDQLDSVDEILARAYESYILAAYHFTHIGESGTFPWCADYMGHQTEMDFVKNRPSIGRYLQFDKLI